MFLFHRLSPNAQRLHIPPGWIPYTDRCGQGTPQCQGTGNNRAVDDGGTVEGLRRIHSAFWHAEIQNGIQVKCPKSSFCFGFVQTISLNPFVFSFSVDSNEGRYKTKCQVVFGMKCAILSKLKWPRSFTPPLTSLEDRCLYTINISFKKESMFGPYRS